MELPTFILGMEPRITVAIARSLHKQGIPVDVGALSTHNLRLSSKAIRDFIYLPDYRGEPDRFLSTLTHLIRTREYSMLIPCVDTALAALIQFYDSLAPLLHISPSSPQLIRRVLEKDLTLEIARSCGVPIPATYHIAGREQLEGLGGTLQFPLVAKPVSIEVHSSFKARYFYNFEQLKEAFAADPQFGIKNLIQDFFVGDGVGIAALMWDGKPVAMFQHRRIKENPITGGVSVLAVSEPLDPILVEHTITLLRALEWQGIAMVEFRFNRSTKAVTLMEVNGRYWGSMSSAIQAGVDFPFYEWQLAHGKTPSPQAGYTTGMQVRWLTGDILRLHELIRNPPDHDFPQPTSVWKEALQFVADFRPSTRKMLWALEDPMPAMQELYKTLRNLFVSDLKGLLRRLLPPNLVRSLSVYRSLSEPASSVYLKFLLLRALGLRRDQSRELPPLRTILFVCHGNIIRSPMAEALFKQQIADGEPGAVCAISAGLHAKPERCADRRAISVAREFGIDLEKHRAQPITSAMIENADAIFVMDRLNEAKLLALYPQAANKVFMLGVFAGNGHASDIEIPDPYHGTKQDIHGCYAVVQSAVRNLVSTARTQEPLKADIEGSHP